MLNKRFICFLIIILFLSMSVAFAADNETSALADEIQTGGNSFESIQAGIDAAQSGETVIIDNYHSGENEIIVKDSINLEGKNNAVLDGKNKTRIMDIAADNVNITNVCFKNSGEHAILIEGNNITIANCTFEGNQERFGGAIYQDPNYICSNLKIIGCTFKDNCNPLYIYGCDDVTIVDSSFSGSLNGAINLLSNNVIIRNCVFTANAGESGGAIGSVGYQPGCKNVTVCDCRFDLNEKSIVLDGRDIRILNSSFTNTDGCALTLCGLNHTIADSSFINNSGGGINHNGFSRYMLNEFKYDGDEKFIVRNCDFSNNTAYSGGAIYYDCSGLYNVEEIADGSKINVNEGFIDNCTFTDNHAQYGSGGAIAYLAYENSNIKVTYLDGVTISNSSFSNNFAEINGGDILICGNDNRILCCNFSGSSSYMGGSIAARDNFTVDKCDFRNSHAYDSGGAIDYCGLHMEVNDCRFENCSAAICSGAIEIVAPVDNMGNTILGEVIINNTKFINNTAEVSAGAVQSYNCLKIDNCEFIDNHADYSSAAIWFSYSKIGISNSRFINNTSPWGAIRFNSCEYELDNNYYSGNALGTFLIGKEYNYKVFNDSFIEIKLFKISAPKLTTYYKSGKYFKVTITELVTGKPVKGFNVIIKDKTTGKSYKRTTDSKGNAYLNYMYSKIGKHAIEVTLAEPLYSSDKVASTLQVTKIPTVVKAPKVTYKHKKSKYFKVTVKVGKTPLKNTYVKIKIDKKTYKVKTDAKGIAKVNTKKLKVGKHKVVISSGNAYYAMSGKSTITIKK